MSKKDEALKLALTRIAEGNLGDAPWQANYSAIKRIAAEALAEQPAQQEPVAWVPYLSDRADGVKGHYAIARWNPRGYREVWNLRSHQWSAYSDDVMSLEEADALLRLITIPTRKVTSPPAQQEPEPDRVKFERHWRKTRGEKKANRELPRHPLQPQTYIQDSANRHWVTWQAAVRSVAPPAQRTWVGLTDDEVINVMPDDDTPMSLGEAFSKFAELVEAKLKEKNT